MTVRTPEVDVMVIMVHVEDTIHRVDVADVEVTVRTVSIGQICSTIPVLKSPMNYTIYCS